MDCYLLLVEEDKQGICNSNQVLINLLNDIFPDGNKPTHEIGFAYQETVTFPKRYYFNTTSKDLLAKLKSKYVVIEGDFPIKFTNENYFQYLGDYHLLPVKL